MTPFDAAALSALALCDRRLVAAVLRVLGGRATADDEEALPARRPDEPLLPWIVRCRACRATAAADHDLELEARRHLDRAARCGITPLPHGDPAYPPLLAQVPDPPAMLWVRGDPEALAAPAVAIVGSRAATPYGLAMARHLASDLAHRGVAIVSGLARGIDAAAHQAAVDAGGRTVAVLGCGADRVYPAEHRELARAIEDRGAVASEFPPGTPPRRHHFPMRNRVISGLSRGVLVVEAPEKSGALITASSAAEQGREVMVVPGPATGGRNRGGHLLVRDGARLVETAGDVLQDLPGLAGADAPSAFPARAVAGSGPAATAAGLLPLAAVFSLDEVAEQTGKPAHVVAALLLELELTGEIQRIGGGRFVRVLT